MSLILAKKRYISTMVLPGGNFGEFLNLTLAGSNFFPTESILDSGTVFARTPRALSIARAFDGLLSDSFVRKHTARQCLTVPSQGR